MSTSPVIVLHSADNVAVCRRSVSAGEKLSLGGDVIVARYAIDLGHKIARRFIPLGDEVIKFGVAIGVTTKDVHPGDWIHLHNMKSNYIPSHIRNSESQRT